MYVQRRNSGLGDFMTDLSQVLQSGSQLVQAVRPPAIGVTPSSSPQLQPPRYVAPAPASSLFSDPMTLALIAFGGLAVLLIIMRR